MATKKQISASELVDSHKPKNFKFKYIFHDDQLLFTLEDEKYDILSLDTIHNDELSSNKKASFRYFQILHFFTLLYES